MTRIKTKDFQEKIAQIKTKDFYEPKEQREIDWSAYTLNQINDIMDTLKFIKREVDKAYTPDKRKRVGRPPTDAGNLAKAVLFTELFGFPERKAEGWLRLLGHHMGIYENIDDRVLGNAYKNPQVISILEEVFIKNRSSDGENGGDGTGLETSRKENYETTKKKNRYMTSIVDSREVVQCFDTSGKQECIIMHRLVKELGESMKKCIHAGKSKLTLDAGFVDRKLTQLIHDSGLEPYIFPKKNLTLKSKGFPAWRNMWLKLLKQAQEWLREYHMRSHTESFHSSFKRVFGIVTKVLDDAVYTQVLCRIIHHNRRRVSYFEMARL